MKNLFFWGPCGSMQVPNLFPTLPCVLLRSQGVRAASHELRCPREEKIQQVERLALIRRQSCPTPSRSGVRFSPTAVLVAVVLLWVVVSIWSWWTDDSEYVSRSPSTPHTCYSLHLHPQDNYLDMFYSNKSLCLSITVFFFVYILGFFDRQNAANM